MTGYFGQICSCLCAAAFRKLKSNGALCATNTVSSAGPRNSRSVGKISAILGDEKTISSVMPVRSVMNGGIEFPGFMKL